MKIKENNMKIIFFTTIVLLIVFAIYYIFKNNKILINEIETKKLTEQIDNNIIMGITEFDTINPIISKSQDIQYISKLIYKPLIDITEDFNLKQGLAEEWNEIDKKTYIIKLKENETWDNGTNVTSDDVKYTIEYISNNEGIYSNNIQNIESIEKIDKYMFKLHLKVEDDNFPYTLCFPIISKDINLSTGKFRINKIENNEILLKSKESNMQLTIRNYENITDLYNAFSNKKVDFIVTNNISYKDFIGEIGYKSKKICGRNFGYIIFNVQNEIFDNNEIIKAIQYAINKEEIIDVVFNNVYMPAESYLQYRSYLYNDFKCKYDINKAKKLLEENSCTYNGKNWTKNGKALRLDIVTNGETEKIAQIIKSELEILGIETNVIVRNNPEEYCNKQDYEMILMEKIVPLKPNVLNQYFAENTNFMELYFSSIILLYSENLKGNFFGNWYNIFYNIDTWYKTI